MYFMPKDFSGKTFLGINIGDFTGIYRAIAEKANINGGNTLEGREINLFYEAKNTIDKSKSIFQFDGKTYDSEGKLYTGKAPLIAEPDATVVKFPWQPTPNDFLKAEEARLKNKKALQQVDEYVQKAENEKQKAKPVKTITGNYSVSFDKNNYDDKDTLTEAMNNRIFRYIKIHNSSSSALLDKAYLYLKNAEEKGVDPFILIAINLYESSYGTSSAAINHNNIGGLKVGGKVKHCKDINSSIAESANVLSKNKHHGNLQNVARNGNYVYGQQAERQLWLKDVISIANGLREEYNKLLK